MFLALQRPAVYLLIRNKVIVYIGVSGHAGERIFRTNHHILAEEVKKKDRLVVWPMPSLEQAIHAEKLMIECIRPKYNRRGRITNRKLDDLAQTMGVTRRTARKYA